MRALDLTGQRYGKLTVTSKSHTTASGQSYWLCQCDCGNKAVVRLGNLRSGEVKSCGCLTYEASKTHGASYKPEYQVWRDMKNRCNNPRNRRYADYGGRGITVCPEWEASYEAFIKDMGPRPEGRFTIERIDNDKGYGPDNCKWATYSEQNRNRRNH